MVTSYPRPMYPAALSDEALQARARRAYEASRPEAAPCWDSRGDSFRENRLAFARELLKQSLHVENAFPEIRPEDVRPGDTVHIDTQQYGITRTFDFTVTRTYPREVSPGWDFFGGDNRYVVSAHPYQDSFAIYLIHRPAPQLEPGTVLKDVVFDGPTYPIGIVRENDGGVSLITSGGYQLSRAVRLEDLESYTVAQVVAK